MSIEQMRAAIRNVYSNARWDRRVSLMPDHQVLAVYQSFKERGMFNKRKPPKRRSFKPYIGVQLTIDDIV